MHISRCNLADPALLRRLHAIQRAAYSVEAELIGSRAIPPLHETVEELAVSREEFWGAFADRARGEGVASNCLGFIALEPAGEADEGGELRIARLAVDPHYFRMGVARLLITHALKLPTLGPESSREEPPAERLGSRAVEVVVSTGAANLPARRLYESFGFELHREFVADGVRVVELRRHFPHRTWHWGAPVLNIFQTRCVQNGDH